MHLHHRFKVSVTLVALVLSLSSPATEAAAIVAARTQATIDRGNMPKWWTLHSEKAIPWDRMARAREDSLAAWTDKRIVKIFKKYKVRNEFSIDYFGYGYRKRYQARAQSQR